MRIRTLAVALAACTVATMAITAGSTAFANPDHGAGTTHLGGHEHNGSQSFAGLVPCHLDLGGYWVTITYNAVLHGTSNKNGYWGTFTETGTFSAYPIEVVTGTDGNPVFDDLGNMIPITDTITGDPVTREGETFTGKLTIWGGVSINPNESVETFTFNIHGVGSEGTTVDGHENAHITTTGPDDPENPQNDPKVAFDKVSCT